MEENKPKVTFTYESEHGVVPQPKEVALTDYMYWSYLEGSVDADAPSLKRFDLDVTDPNANDMQFYNRPTLLLQNYYTEYFCVITFHELYDIPKLWDNGDNTYKVYFEPSKRYCINYASAQAEDNVPKLVSTNRYLGTIIEDVPEGSHLYLNMNDDGTLSFIEKSNADKVDFRLFWINNGNTPGFSSYDYDMLKFLTEPIPYEEEWNITHNLTAEDLPILEAEGYIFKGWSMDYCPTNMNGSNILSVGDIGDICGDTVGETFTLRAVWEEEATPTVDYTITYQSEHGTAPSSKVVTVNEGESYTLTANDLPTLTAEGYIFKGWSMSVGDTINADTVLTAIWEEATVDYTISYSTAHGTAPSSKNVVVYYGESYKLSAIDLPTLSADGFVFGGWSVNGQIVSAGYEITADTTLTAVWVEDLPVSKIDYQSMMLGLLIGSQIKL